MCLLNIIHPSAFRNKHNSHWCPFGGQAVDCNVFGKFQLRFGYSKISKATVKKSICEGHLAHRVTYSEKQTYNHSWKNQAAFFLYYSSYNYSRFQAIVQFIKLNIWCPSQVYKKNNFANWKWKVLQNANKNNNYLPLDINIDLYQGY